MDDNEVDDGHDVMMVIKYKMHVLVRNVAHTD
jgi:hypothetical protein